MLACVIDKEGHACVQIQGYGARILSALESIISGLVHQSKVPPELMTKAIINGIKGVEPTGVIDLGGGNDE